jgi:hypothetical protein
MDIHDIFKNSPTPQRARKVLRASKNNRKHFLPLYIIINNFRDNIWEGFSPKSAQIPKRIKLWTTTLQKNEINSKGVKNVPVWLLGTRLKARYCISEPGPRHVFETR